MKLTGVAVTLEAPHVWKVLADAVERHQLEARLRAASLSHSLSEQEPAHRPPHSLTSEGYNVGKSVTLVNLRQSASMPQLQLERPTCCVQRPQSQSFNLGLSGWRSQN